MKNPVSFRALILGSLYITLLVLLLGVFVLGYGQKRDFLEDHLAQSSQDAATSLALSISTVADAGDWVIASTMIDVIFDSGAYALVSLSDTAGNNVFKREAPVSYEGVPRWFVDRVELAPPLASADIVGGWKKLGMLTVQSSPAAAYRALWRSLRVQLLWFAMVAFATSLVFKLILYQMLRPLQRLTEVAGRIQQKDFSQRIVAPPITELAEVAIAFNQMSGQLGALFLHQHETIERLREQTLVDPVTRLDNRDSFDRRLQAELQSEESDAAGHLLILQVEGFAHFNQLLGRTGADGLLKTIAELIKDETNAVKGHVLAGRREGAQFGVYVALPDMAQAVQFAERLVDRVRALPGFRSVQPDFRMGMHVGIAPTEGVRMVGQLLAAADFALREAQSLGRSGVACHATLAASGQAVLKSPLNSSAWQQLLRDALSQQTFQLHFQPMLKADRSQVLFHQVLIRLPMADRLLTAGEFLPMAERFNLMHDIDLMVLSRVLQRLGHSPEDGVLCVTLSSASLHHNHLGEALGALFRRFPLVVHQLLLEVPEYALRQAWAGIDQLLMLRMNFGFRIVVNRFGMSGIPFGYLESWPVNMIKLDPGLVDHIDDNSQHQFYLINVVQIAHSRDVDVIVVGVERKEEADALESLGVDGLMGYFICRPQTEPVHLS